VNHRSRVSEIGSVLAAAALVALSAVTPRRAAAQQRPVLDCAPVGARHVRLISAHHAESGPLIEQALAHDEYRVCVSPLGLGDVPSDSVVTTSLVIFIGSGSPTIPTSESVSITGQVHGDVIVIGGDLFVRPGAIIDGRAVSIGGGVFTSALAKVRGVTIAERGARTAWIGTDSVALTYEPARRNRPGLITLPVFFGARIPAYDRVDGLSVAWGPQLNIDSARIVFDPLVTYRSNLGKFDPSGTLDWNPGGRWSVNASAERGTLTNDAWSRPTIFNSISTLVTGSDARNYFRSDRLQLAVSHAFGSVEAGVLLVPSLGVRDEYDRSVGADSDVQHVVWSLLDRSTPDKVHRANPSIDDGRIVSGLGGLRAGYNGRVVSVQGALGVEVPFASPGTERYVQTTVDGILKFVEFTDQTFQFGLHSVVTLGDTAQPQRYSYLGGGSTIPTLDILARGGDELVWFYGEYLAPLRFIKLPFVGHPSVGVYAVTGSAGVHGLPSFTTNVGPRFALSIFELDWLIDPVRGLTNVSVGVNFGL